MNKKDIYEMTDEELLVEKKNLKNTKLFYAFAIGFLAAILVFGFIGWIISPKKSIGVLIPLFFPIIFIYKLLKNSNKNKDLEELLKKRGLD